MPGKIRVGVSGWTYPPWRGRFYPDKLPHRSELAYAASCFPSIEVNGTFYSMQRPRSFADWYDATPDGFVFAVKGPRYVTHMLRLQRAETALGNFFASGLLRLGPKLGPILWQLPPNFRFDAPRLETFFALLPRDTEAAVACGRRHDSRLKDRAWLKVEQHRRIRHALEIRNHSFCDAEFIKLLRRHDIALVCADTVEWPLLMDLTSDFVYVRLHGSTELYRSAYGRAALMRWAARIEAWARGRSMTDGNFAATATARRLGRDVFVYFDNTDKLNAPRDACSLMRLLARTAAGS